MPERKKILFAGNGINFIENSKNLTWNELIKKLYESNGFATEYENLHVANMESMNQFEPLLNLLDPKIKKENAKNNGTQKTDDYISSQTVKMMNDMVPNIFHKTALENYDEIITINYDLCFEKAAKCNNKPDSDENLYNLSRKINLAGFGKFKCKTIWHPHGAENPKGICKSICQTREAYTKNLATLKECLTKEEKVLSDKSVFKVEDITVWAQHILYSDIDMIGCGMSFNEIDMWWLLSYRAYLKRVYPRYKLNKIKYFTKHSQDKKEIAKLSLLKSLYVDIIYIKGEKEWGKDFYMKCFDSSFFEVETLK